MRNSREGLNEVTEYEATEYALEVMEHMYRLGAASGGVRTPPCVNALRERLCGRPVWILLAVDLVAQLPVRLLALLAAAEYSPLASHVVTKWHHSRTPYLSNTLIVYTSKKTLIWLFLPAEVMTVRKQGSFESCA